MTSYGNPWWVRGVGDPQNAKKHPYALTQAVAIVQRYRCWASYPPWHGTCADDFVVSSSKARLFLLKNLSSSQLLSDFVVGVMFMFLMMVLTMLMMVTPWTSLWKISILIGTPSTNGPCFGPILNYLLVICYIAFENVHRKSVDYIVKMVIFDSFVTVYQRLNLHLSPLFH